jgi:adenylate kinase
MVAGVAPLEAAPPRHSPAFAPGPMLLLGAPGVGKGTQAKAIMAAWGIPQISTGDILRENVALGTELGLEAKRVMDRGELVSDAIVNAMVEARLQREDAASGYVLDGYPRTLRQSEFFDRLLERGLFAGSGANGGPRRGAELPVVAVSIRVPYDQLLRRITGRRVCLTGKHIYNIYFQPPALDNVCDFDGSPLQQRSDDREEVFVERMKAYEDATAPVVAHYRGLGRFAEVDGERSVDQVTTEILAAVERLRTQA